MPFGPVKTCFEDENFINFTEARLAGETSSGIRRSSLSISSFRLAGWPNCLTCGASFKMRHSGNQKSQVPRTTNTQHNILTKPMIQYSIVIHRNLCSTHVPNAWNMLTQTPGNAHALMRLTNIQVLQSCKRSMDLMTLHDSPRPGTGHPTFRLVGYRWGELRNSHPQRSLAAVTRATKLKHAEVE